MKMPGKRALYGKIVQAVGLPDLEKRRLRKGMMIFTFVKSYCKEESNKLLVVSTVG